ncbi:unnamed protein product [Dibothriocephalus latus]|uniref:Acylamino-acid-releasing enzyme N-terminal domain-containing protein n=1 Tax=Dibothriocephalus latus TaxID=60516 RepID=A0A3P6PDL2_DIBLA|nr:unnamed protein product [Dibothriocephalus latus]
MSVTLLILQDSKEQPQASPFLMPENWGEGISTAIQPVMCILDIEDEKVDCLHSQLQTLLPACKHWAFDSALWAPDGSGLVFVAYDKDPFRLGLIYCYQRSAQLYYWNFVRAALSIPNAQNFRAVFHCAFVPVLPHLKVYSLFLAYSDTNCFHGFQESWCFNVYFRNVRRTETSQVQCLNRPDRAAHWPRFSPDGSKLVWFEMPSGGPHNQCFELLARDWPPTAEPAEVVVPLVASPKSKTDFPGLFALACTISVCGINPVACVDLVLYPLNCTDFFP